jgi:hypothetical protein
MSRSKREQNIEANSYLEIGGNKEEEGAEAQREQLSWARDMANNNYEGTAGKSGQDPDGDVGSLIISVPSVILFAH